MVEHKPVQEDSEIIEEMNQMYNTCTECGSGVYNTLKLWSDKAVCNECYIKKRDELSNKIQEYIKEKGYNACKFCDKKRDSIHGFHFDHINMFDKGGAVGNMVWTGVDINKIKEEIHKCQLLCVSCHSLVTYYERKYGFIDKKKKKVQGLGPIYAEKMEKIYELIKKVVKPVL